MLVVDASVGLKWVLSEPDSHLADALLRLEPVLVIPDFWLNEATNVLWLQVRRGRLARREAREALGMLHTLMETTPTTALRLHDLALDIGMEVALSPYDALYLAFAISVGASAVADLPFSKAVRSHPDPELAGMVMSLGEWAATRGLSP